jgi:phosphatidylserine decarboxylase
MSIHKAGIIPLIIIIFILLIINFLIFYFLGDYQYIVYTIHTASLFLLFMALNFFRNPKRNIIINENICISPADGEVVVIEETIENEYFKDKRLQVSIFMSVWNVHMNRYPISGVIKYAKYHKGKYLLARNPKSSLENERTSTVIADNNGTEIMFRQIAGIVARRIIYRPIEGYDVQQGDEMGFIRFGSRVDIFFPLQTKVKVKLGDKVRGGIAIIAELK